MLSKNSEIRTGPLSTITGAKSINKLFLGDLLGGEQVKSDNTLSILKKSLKKQNVLKTPLPKAEHEKIRRLIGYNEAVNTMTKWEPVVLGNRKVKQMNYPLVQPDIKIIDKSTMFNKDQKPQTKLELAVANVLKANKELVIDKKPLSALEERALQAMSLEEAKARRAELQKQRALLSYYGAKMKRQGKIKSKRFHRIQRKSRQKAEEKKLEVMKDRDPEAYQEWLYKEERKRIEERMTLKHKGGSKSMKRQAKYGKYNSQSRQAVQDMIQKGKEIASKRIESSSDEGDDNEDDQENNDDDTDDDVVETQLNDANDDDNVVDIQLNDANDDDDDVKNEEPQFSLDENLKRKKTLEDMEGVDNDDESDDDDDDDEAKGDDGGEGPVDDVGNFEGDEFEKVDSKLRKRKHEFDEKESLKKLKIAKNKYEINVQPNQYLKVEEETGITHSSITSPNSKAFTIGEAMADDDVIAEFFEEKKSIEERDKVKDIDMTLPGWGEWTGPGIKVSMKKRKKFTIKAPKGPPRKDHKLNAVIISELKDEAIAKHQVSSLPWYHKNVHEFQKSIKQPIGKQWNREEVYRKKIMPKNFIKLGQIIDPIDQSDVFNKRKKSTFNFDNNKNNDKNENKGYKYKSFKKNISKKHKKHN